MSAPSATALSAQLARIRLFLCDVDGVLTDGTVTIGNGTEYKQFNIQDGLGLHLLRRGGIKVGWISNRPSTATLQRSDELKIDYLHQKGGNKVAAAEAIMSQAQVDWAEVCFVGDDVVDLGVMKRVGVAVAVANAIDEAKAVAHYVTQTRGGEGAVREVVRLILVSQNKWSGLIDDYSQ